VKIDDKISDRKIAYFFRQDSAIAFELSLLYYVLAKRKNARQKISEAGRQSLYWLKISGVAAPEYLDQLSPAGLLEEIEKLLVLNKIRCANRSEAKVGAKLSPQTEIMELRGQFGLA
jgi:hypothetical protein